MTKNCVWCNKENTFPFCDKNCQQASLSQLKSMVKIWGDNFKLSDDEKIIWENFIL